MEEIFEFIEDTGKRLNRPIKDLDDIRIAMKALSEVRENEIRIDMEIGPIEVRISEYVIKSREMSHMSTIFNLDIFLW